MPTPIGLYRWPSFDAQIDYYTYKDPNSGCWIWLGTLNRGYAMALNKTFGKETKVHRMSYAYYRGAVPSGRDVVIDHLCRVKCCVNPWHMELVTFGENIRRATPFRKPNYNKVKTHCDHGHEFTPANTAITSEGWRRCRECHRIRQLKVAA